MLVDIDEKNGHEFIIDELDEEHILVKETKVAELKQRLQNVRATASMTFVADTLPDDERASQGAREF
jgi:ribonuclease BN (tRNA processing enzyme)